MTFLFAWPLPNDVIFCALTPRILAVSTNLALIWNSVDWAHQHIGPISSLPFNVYHIPSPSSHRSLPWKSKSPGKRCPRLFWHYFQMSIACDLISSLRLSSTLPNWVSGGSGSWQGGGPSVGSNAIKVDNTIQFNEVRLWMGRVGWAKSYLGVDFPPRPQGRVHQGWQVGIWGLHFQRDWQQVVIGFQWAYRSGRDDKFEILNIECPFTQRFMPIRWLE